MKNWRWAWNIGAVIVLSGSAVAQCPVATTDPVGWALREECICPAGSSCFWVDRKSLSGTATVEAFSRTLSIGQPPTESSKKVEKLTDAEIRTIAEADKALSEAQAKHDAIIDKIKLAHGEFHCPSPVLAVACFSETHVGLWGDFALIENVKLAPMFGAAW